MDGTKGALAKEVAQPAFIATPAAHQAAIDAVAAEGATPTHNDCNLDVLRLFVNKLADIKQQLAAAAAAPRTALQHPREKRTQRETRR